MAYLLSYFENRLQKVWKCEKYFRSLLCNKR